MSGPDGVKGNGRKPDPFGGTGPIPSTRGWGSYITGDVSSAALGDSQSPDGITVGAMPGAEARVNEALAAQKRRGRRVANLKTSLPVVLEGSLIERGIPAVLPAKLVKGLVNTIAEVAVAEDHQGQVDVGSICALSKKWGMRHYRDLLSNLLELGADGSALIAEDVFFQRLADAMRADPNMLVVQHLKNKGVKPYARKNALLPGVAGVVRAVNMSELGSWGDGEAWLVDMESDMGVHEEPVIVALGRLAEQGRYQPVNVFLDTYAAAVKDNGPKFEKGRGSPDGYVQGIPKGYVEKRGIPPGMRYRQALPQGRPTFMQTLAARVPAWTAFRRYRFA